MISPELHHHIKELSTTLIEPLQAFCRQYGHHVRWSCDHTLENLPHNHGGFFWLATHSPVVTYHFMELLEDLRRTPSVAPYILLDTKLYNMNVITFMLRSRFPEEWQIHE